MSHFKFAIIPFIIYLVIGCDPKPERDSAYFTNSSKDLVYVMYSLSLLTIKDALDYKNRDWYIVLPDETIEFKYIHPDYKLYVLIYKPETFKKYTLEELIENDIIDYRYEFTYEELEARDFTITFTGD